MGGGCIVCGDEPVVWFPEAGDFCGEHRPDRCDDPDHTRLHTEIERLRAALVEKQARGNWYRFVAEVGYGLSKSSEWQEGDDPRLLPENQTRNRLRQSAPAELIAEGLLPPE